VASNLPAITWTSVAGADSVVAGAVVLVLHCDVVIPTEFEVSVPPPHPEVTARYLRSAFAFTYVMLLPVCGLLLSFDQLPPPFVEYSHLTIVPVFPVSVNTALEPRQMIELGVDTVPAALTFVITAFAIADVAVQPPPAMMALNMVFCVTVLVIHVDVEAMVCHEPPLVEYSQRVTLPL